MVIHLHVPLGIRIPPRLTAADFADLERATGNALNRALDAACERMIGTAHTSVGEEYPSWGPVASSSREFSFDERIYNDVRVMVTDAIGRGIDYAFGIHGLSAEVGAPAHEGLASTVAALGRLPREKHDSSRRSGPVYRIPVYDDGTVADVQITGTDVSKVKEEREPTVLTHEDALNRAWLAHRVRYGSSWNPEIYGYPGYYGSFSKDGELWRNCLIYISEVTAIDEEGWPLERSWQADSFVMINYVEEKDGFDRVSLASSMDHCVLYQTDQPATVENLLPLADMQTEFTPEVRKRMAEEAADPRQVIYRLEDGAQTLYIALTPGVERRGGIAHSPVRFIVQPQGRGAEAGTGAGDGGRERTTGQGRRARGGRRGGPLRAATEGDGSIWPTSGLDGEVLVCTPYLGEPAIAELISGGDRLDGEIRELASLLEVDFCGYAGRFCLNAAMLIGARAHAIGITSITSTVTTAVTARPDGAGNHGFVDIRPGRSPELQYMEKLGDLAAGLKRLSGMIASIYSAGPNRHLIFWDSDRDYDPDPEAWLTRFNYKFNEDSEISCMYLFAETCRVILLQQLRSSYAAITTRQGRFKETLALFNEALGILGESVVKLSVLNQALGHANRLHVTGSVRDVLSRRPPIRPMGRGEHYDPPAPIEWIAPRIVELLEGATIEVRDDVRVVKFQQRTWTTDELDQGIALRRGTLNRVDPLFLQVGDLDKLYRQFRSDESHTHQYLTDLLADLREANEKMTSETSDWDDGAFFALEASKYVKANGGYNSLGLKYDLQGIHQLADEVLRPFMGSVDAYRRGINRAVGIKAGWDDFIGVFSVAGIVVLALLCAPLGVIAVGAVTGAAGIALTIHDLAEAERLEKLYRSLEDPEAILSWEDVQLQRLMANLSIAFAVFDVAGVAKAGKVILAGVRHGLREATEQGLRGTARSAVVAVRRRVLANMAGEVLDNALRQALSDATVGVAMNAVLPTVIEPVLVPWIRGVAVAHGTLAEVDAILGPLTSGYTPVPESIVLADIPKILDDSGPSEMPETLEEPVELTQ